MTELFQSWDSFWTRETSPHALAIVRIALGVFLLLYAALYLPHIDFLFSNRGIALPLFEETAPASLDVLILPQDPWVARTVFTLLLIGIIGLTMGVYLHGSLLLIILSALYFWQLQLHLFPASYNRLLLFTLCSLLFGGADKAFSIAMYRKHGSWLASETISILPVRLLTLQITFTFLGVGLQKFWLPQWQGGEVLVYSFIGRWGSPLAYTIARLPLSLEWYDMLLLFVKCFEVVLPFGLWIPPLRGISVLGMSLFLLSIAVLLHIWWFVFLIPCGLLFFPSESVLSGLRKLFSIPGPLSR